MKNTAIIIAALKELNRQISTYAEKNQRPRTDPWGMSMESQNET